MIMPGKSSLKCTKKRLVVKIYPEGLFLALFHPFVVICISRKIVPFFYHLKPLSMCRLDYTRIKSVEASRGDLVCHR